jgi:HK97 family phage prohead protease
MIRKAMPARLRTLGDLDVEAVLSTRQRARDGHILEPAGADLTGFRANPIILWSHDPDQPVGRAENIDVAVDRIVARIRFAAPGASETADRIRQLVKGGIINTMSVGFDVIDATPIDPAKPRGGMRITSWTLMEASFVSVPADTGAVVTMRAGKVLSAANLGRLQKAMEHHAALGDSIRSVLDDAADGDPCDFGSDDNSYDESLCDETEGRARRRRDLERLRLAGAAADDPIDDPDDAARERRAREVAQLRRSAP